MYTRVFETGGTVILLKCTNCPITKARIFILNTEGDWGRNGRCIKTRKAGDKRVCILLAEYHGAGQVNYYLSLSETYYFIKTHNC